MVITASDDVYTRLAARGFTARYPGIQVLTQPSQPTDRATVVITQDRAGRVEIDLVAGSPRDVVPLVERGLVYKPTAQEWATWGYPMELVGASGHHGLFWDFVYAHAYNTRLVSAAERPRTLQDFLDPKWRDKIVASPFLYPAGFAFVALREGEEPAKNLAAQIHAQSRVNLNNAYLQLLDSGEFALLMFTSVNNTIKSQRAGAPVEFFFTPTMGVARQGLSITKAAPHPNAARLFLHWMSTAEGKNALFEQEAQALAAGPGVDNPISRAVRDAGVEIIFEDDANWQERARITGVIREALVGG